MDEKNKAAAARIFKEVGKFRSEVEDEGQIPASLTYRQTQLGLFSLLGYLPSPSEMQRWCPHLRADLDDEPKQSNSSVLLNFIALGTAHATESPETNMRKILKSSSPVEPIRNSGRVPMDLQKFTEVACKIMASRDREEDTRHTFLAFDDRCRGFLTLEGVKTVLREPDIAPGLSDATIEDLFDELDTNRDGRISYKEFRSVLELVNDE